MISEIRKRNEEGKYLDANEIEFLLGVIDRIAEIENSAEDHIIVRDKIHQIIEEAK